MNRVKAQMEIKSDPSKAEACASWRLEVGSGAVNSLGYICDEGSPMICMSEHATATLDSNFELRSTRQQLMSRDDARGKAVSDPRSLRGTWPNSNPWLIL